MIEGAKSDLVKQAYTRPVDAVTSVATTRGQFIPRDEHRTSLLISPPLTNDVWLSWSPGTGASAGIRLVAGGAPLVLSLLLHGALVYGPIYAASPAGQQNLGWAGAALPCHCTEA